MQSKLTKFHHAYEGYWDAVEKALIEQYHRSEHTAGEWSAEKMFELEDANGGFQIPDTPPERMAQEIFMERAE